jgi:crossover junction endodeoxyribonuclease RuvC
MGWAIGDIEKRTVKPLDFGCWESNRKQTLFERYHFLLTSLNHVIEKYHPDQLAIEKLYFSKNVTTALPVSEVRGMVIGVCLDHAMHVSEYSPNQVKLAVTGQGNADKKAVAKMLSLQLKLPLEGILDDAIDALALVLTHAASAKLAIL